MIGGEDVRADVEHVQDGGGVCGVLLAAGAGRRAGGPKVLRHDPDGSSWLLRAVSVLFEGGCQAVVVVLGCGADLARATIAGSDYQGDERLSVVEAADWQEGMGRSLRTGLLAAASGGFRAVIVHLVDLPDVTSPVVVRLLRTASRPSLARATYRGQPGHPVLIGSDHWSPIIDELAGDSGARDYLDRHGVVGVDCGDLATGQDRDR